MHRSRLILQNAASKAATSRGAAATSSEAIKKQQQTLLSFDEKTAAQILLSSHCHPLPPYKPLYHHLDPNLLKPREPGSLSYLFHHIQSSLSGFYSICTSQASRDEFLQLTSRNNEDQVDNNDGDEENNVNTSIINTLILNQSDMGGLKAMTLFQDLNNPLLDETTFDKEKELRQFLAGCSFAIQQFHVTQRDYLNSLTSLFDNGKARSDENDEEESDNIDDDQTNMAYQYQFFDKAKADSSSIESTLISMLSPEGLDRIFFDTAMFSLARNMNSQIMAAGGDKGDRKSDIFVFEDSFLSSLEPNVLHACLLSARVEEIHAMNENNGSHNDEDKNDPDAPLEDESLQPFPELRSDRDKPPQTVLQLEVLYDLEFTPQADDDKKKSFKSVNVAKFETCLKGDPNGDDRQWRLCSW